MISRNCFRKTFFFRLFDLLVFTGKTLSNKILSKSATLSPNKSAYEKFEYGSLGSWYTKLTI